MWSTIYVTPNNERAKQVEDNLTKEGYYVKINQLSVNGEGIYEVLAPSFELEEIQETMIELGII